MWGEEQSPRFSFSIKPKKHATFFEPFHSSFWCLVYLVYLFTIFHDSVREGEMYHRTFPLEVPPAGPGCAAFRQAKADEHELQAQRSLVGRLQRPGPQPPPQSVAEYEPQLEPIGSKKGRWWHNYRGPHHRSAGHPQPQGMKFDQSTKKVNDRWGSLRKEPIDNSTDRSLYSPQHTSKQPAFYWL